MKTESRPSDIRGTIYEEVDELRAKIELLEKETCLMKLMIRTCQWKRVDGEVVNKWDTGCGDSFVGTVFSFEASDHGFCQSCGGKIVLKPEGDDD